MKVLHVVEYLKLGGIERFLDNFTTQRPEETYVLAFEMAAPEGVAIEMIRKGRKLSLMKKTNGHDREVSKKILQLCREHKITTIHTHDFGPMEYAVEAKIFSPKLKLIHTQHTLHHFVSNKKYVMAYNVFGAFYHRLTNVSASVREQIAKRVFGLNSKLVVVPNGISVPKITAKETSAQSPLQIIGVSRLSPEKNIEFTLQGLKNLKRPFLYTHLGDGESQYKASIMKLVADLGLASNVNFVGYTSDVSSHLFKADVFVSSSKEEGMPLSVLEAMGHGVRAFLSDIPAHKEIMQPGVDLYTLADTTEMTQALENLNLATNTFDLQKKISKFVLDNFSIEKMIRDYDSLYRAAHE